MSVNITLDVSHTVVASENDDPSYTVACEVTATEGIDLSLFVYSTTSEEFSHPATVFDLESYPVGRAEAINLGLDYYRQTTVSEEFSTMSDALSFEILIRRRMQYLANDLPQTQDRIFEGTQTYVITTSAS